MIYEYQRISTPGPNGTTFYFINTEDNSAQELAEIDGYHYVFVPDGVDMPEQPPEIGWQKATLTPDLRSRIKAASRQCFLISEEMQRRIRERYSVEDEAYFSRIGVGAALGAYQFEPGEQDELLAFGAHVESVRQWGRERRAEIGL